MSRRGHNATYLIDISDASTVCVCMLCGQREMWTGVSRARALAWLYQHDIDNHPDSGRARHAAEYYGIQLKTVYSKMTATGSMLR